MDAANLTQTLTYIQAHLDGDLSLEALAAVAGCSPPYFARRFSRMMAETPKQYTSRLRLERAALRLVLLDDNILNIALDCGFESHETFTRAFRRHLGVAPSEFRREGNRLTTAAATSAKQELPQRADAATPVSLSSTVIRTLQPMSLAFIRHTGPYEKVALDSWDKLIDWARRRGIPGGVGTGAGGGTGSPARARPTDPYILLGIAHDAPGITKPQHLRFDAAIRIPDSAGDFRSSKRVGHQRFPGGLFALTTTVGPFTSLPAAYHEIFRRLRTNRSLACLGVPCLEFYRVNRVVTDVAIVNTEIAIPVRRCR